MRERERERERERALWFCHRTAVLLRDCLCLQAAAQAAEAAETAKILAAVAEKNFQRRRQQKLDAARLAKEA